MNALPSRHEPSMNLMLDEIDMSETHRAVDLETVKRLAKSIKDLGLHHPITVIRGEDRRFILIAGRHRLEAFRHLGEDRIPAQVVKFCDRDARMWEISENLHRAELTTEQRYEQIAEYARLAKEKREAEKPAHSGPVSGGRGNEGGDRLASRDLGLPRATVQRAQEYASLPEEVKERAIAQGVNVTALLREKELTEARKIEILNEIAERGRATPTLSTRPLRDLVGISGGELARWIKITTPNDRTHVIRVLETAVSILRDELDEGRSVA